MGQNNQVDPAVVDASAPTVSCDVCYGTPGFYPVIDRFGSQLYEIVCPECFGTAHRPAPQGEEDR